MNCPLKGQIKWTSLRHSSVDLSDGHRGSVLVLSFKTTFLMLDEGNHQRMPL